MPRSPVGGSAQPSGRPGWERVGGGEAFTGIRQTMHEAATGCVCGTNRGASLYTHDLLDGLKSVENTRGSWGRRTGR